MCPGYIRRLSFDLKFCFSQTDPLRLLGLQSEKTREITDRQDKVYKKNSSNYSLCLELSNLDVFIMTHQENNENPIWFYNYYGSGFLTIVKHEIYETKVSEKRTLVNPFSETTPLLENSSNDNNNGGTDSYTAMFQNKDEKSQVSFI